MADFLSKVGCDWVIRGALADVEQGKAWKTAYKR